MQTLFAPVVTTLIFLMIFLLAMNGQSRVVGNVPFLQFLAPGLVMGNTTDLSVLGNDDKGEPALKYFWSVVEKPEGADDPDFSANGTNAAKNSTATDL